MKQYEEQNVKNKVNIALEMLLKSDLFLLQNEVNERSISHKLAEYLQIRFPEWHVDCEYNRDHDRTKQLEYPIPSEPIDSLKARTVYPDIIIHRRNTIENLLVIEMKKEVNIEGDDEQKDKNKLQAFIGDPFRYQYGLFITFRTNGKPRLIWFRDYAA